MPICFCCDRRKLHDGCLCSGSACDRCRLCERHCHCVPSYCARLHYKVAFPSDLSLPRGSDEERAFVAALARSPTDRISRLVFADWLDEHGRTDEAELLRAEREAPLVTPFRVMLRWGRFDFRVRKYRALSKRYADHAEAHRYYLCGRGPDPGVLVLNDAEAALAEIDTWPLLPGEPEPIRVRGTFGLLDRSPAEEVAENGREPIENGTKTR